MYAPLSHYKIFSKHLKQAMVIWLHKCTQHECIILSMGYTCYRVTPSMILWLIFDKIRIKNTDILVSYFYLLGVRGVLSFLVAEQLNTHSCVFICLFSVFDMRYLSFFEYQEYSRINEEREISYQKQRTDRQQTSPQMKEIKITSYIYEGQLSTDQDDRKLGLMLIIPFPVWAGIKFSSSSCLDWN